MTDEQEIPIRVVHPPGGSFYAMLFGDGEAGRVLLEVLGLRRRDLGRYRDAWIERGEDQQPRIAVYTRLGGRNRQDYAEIIRGLRAHPRYVLDRDDGYDETYATFYFGLPEEVVETLDSELEDWREQLQGAVNMDDVWRDALRQMGGDPDGD